MAQDFHAAFRLSLNEATIASGEPSSVALAAGQGLRRLVHQNDAQIAALTNRVAELASLRDEPQGLKAAVGALARVRPAPGSRREAGECPFPAARGLIVDGLGSPACVLQTPREESIASH